MKTLAIAFLLLFSLTISAQEINLKGKILDKQTNKPLKDVRINIDNTVVEVSDENGQFDFNANPNSQIVIVLKTYKPVQYKANQLPDTILLERKSNLKLDDFLTPVNEKSLYNGLNENGNQDISIKYRNTQSEAYNPKKWTRHDLLSGGLISTFDDREKEIVGSPYLKKDFSPGYIYMGKDKTKYKANLRYNTLSRKFEIKVDDKIYSISPDKVFLVNYDKHYFIPLYDNAYDLQFFEVIGKYKNKMLIKQTTATKKDEFYAKEVAIGDPRIKIKQFSKYYIKENGKEALKEYKMKKKNISELFGNDPKIMDFIKKNNLKMKKEEDYQKVFDYYYSTLNN